MDIENDRSKLQARFDLADLEQFKLSIRPADPQDLQRRKEAIRKRRKIQHITINENQGESTVSLTNDQLVFTPSIAAPGVKKEVMSENDRIFPQCQSSTSMGKHVRPGAVEDAGSEDDHDITVASHKRSLVRSSKHDPEPGQPHNHDMPQQPENYHRSRASRKDKPSKSSLTQRAIQDSPDEPSRPVAPSKPGFAKITHESMSSEKVVALSSRLPEGKVPATLTVMKFEPPNWYQELQKSKARSRDPLASNTDVSLANLKDYVKKCKIPSKGTNLSAVVQKVRDMLHSLVFMYVTGQLLRDNLMLSNENGLPQMFDPAQVGHVKWPSDIKADAMELYTKWCRKDFDTDIMRGIKFPSKASKGSDSLDAAYPKVDWRHHGNNSLVNGQWWPTQLCTMRDGAHGSPQAGIAGAKGHGAYSVVVAGGLDPEGKPYPDEDFGDWLLYCGTDSKEGISANTAHLLENKADGEPVRLIRSHNAKSRWAPQLGFRYDGLYKVKSAKLIDPPRNRYQFHLERVSLTSNLSQVFVIS
nr:isoform 2 of e3 ubiquitin-protein ligase orthrus 2 [Quercus suber]